MAPHVLVIGGGVGGLALAHGLKNLKISCHVYERDHTQDYRAQGYRFRLSAPGIEALKWLVDDATFQDFELSCAELRAAPIPEIDAESSEVVPPPGAEGLAVPAPDAQPRSVDRSAFRAVFIKNLDPGLISYGKKFTRYEETPEGVVAHFQDGSTAKGTLLVGADGAYSPVRTQLLPDLAVKDTGVVCVYGKTPLTNDARSSIEPVVLQSMSIVKDRRDFHLKIMGMDPVIFPHRREMESRGIELPQDYLFWALSFKDEKRQRRDANESEQHVLELSKHWHPKVRSIVEQQQKGESSSGSVLSIKELPAWEPNQRVTALGDAVHKLAPTGAGALLALRDAQKLCQLLSDRGQSAETIGEYERLMREEASKEIETSWKIMCGMQMTRANEFHFGKMAMQNRARNAARKS